MKLKILLSTAVLLALFSCKKEDPAPEAPEPTVVPAPAAAGPVTLELRHLVDTATLVFGQKYLNAGGDTFSLYKFTYYISNIVLTSENNTSYAVPESYYLVDHAVAASMKISLPDVPAGTYRSVSLLLGVDSTRNTSGIQKGALDPARGMFWSWNTGYIFLKMEGDSPQSGNQAGTNFTYHVGGFSGPNKTQRPFSFSLPDMKVAKDKNPVVSLNVNAGEIFRSPQTIDLAVDFYQASPGPEAKKLADNYADMISFGGVK